MKGIDFIGDKTKDSKCKGYSERTDAGTEYDCDYEFAKDIVCEQCIFGGCGGELDPRKPQGVYEKQKEIMEQYKNLLLELVEAFEKYRQNVRDGNTFDRITVIESVSVLERVKEILKALGEGKG